MLQPSFDKIEQTNTKETNFQSQAMEMDLLDSPVFLAAIALLLLLPALFYLKSSSGKRKRYHPVAGTIFHELLHFRRLHHYYTDLSHRYKTYRIMTTPLQSVICTTEPANVEYILRTNFANYGKGDYNHEPMRDLLGDGIFAVDGDKWRHQRKLASFEFSARVLRDFSSVVFKNNAVKLAQLVSEAASSDQRIDIQDLLMKSTMESIFKVAFGIELNCLHGSNTEGSIFARAFDDSSMLITYRFVNPFWRIMKFLNMGSEAQLKKKIKVVNDFVYKLIDTKIRQMSSKPCDSVKKEDILTRFLQESEKDPHNVNHQYMRDIILNFVIAGKDTTAGTLSWFFYMLCKHPYVQGKIAQEVKEATGADNGTKFGEFTVSITEEALNKMQYLHASLTETLRLYPSVPIDSKVCFSNDTLPDGFNVKKGDVVAYLPYPMGRMKSLWGEDAEDFRPERWLDANGLFCPESPFKFTAFQAGPRICLGKEFAYRQMKIFVAVLLHFFTFKLSDEKKAVNYRTMLTLHVDGGLHLNASISE